MAKTFLELVNYVLTALREDTVLSFTESYTAMIAQMVNDAKEEVEDAGSWRALRTEVSFTSTAATDTTTLSSTNARSYLLKDDEGNGLLFRTDSGHEMRVNVVSMEALRGMRLGSAPVSQLPSAVAFTTDGTNLIAHFFPTPDATYTYKGIFVIPQAELSAKTDTLTVPWRPVVRRAVFFAMDERGSEFAGRLETEAAKAQRALDQAILTDFGSEPMQLYEE